jgi:flap endonuclease-1
MDSSGRVTSHLSGILYRITNLIEAGVRVAFVFDGEPPHFKHSALQERAEVREKARIQWEEAKALGEDGFKYAQASSHLNEEILSDAKRLLGAMGVPVVQAPSEGEAQAAHMARRGDVDFVASQDYDSLLFGAPRVVRNLAITGRRKLPRKNVYVEVEPEVIELEEELRRLSLDQGQLVEMGMLCGTDYNSGLSRVGPKTALKLLKEHGHLEKVMEAHGETIPNFQEIREFFLHPLVTEKYEVKMRRPVREEIVSFLCQERDFSTDRVSKAAERLLEAYKVGQCTLDRWF